MCRINPDGSNFQVIGEGIDPAVSPDGKTVVFARQMPKGHCLFTTNIDGTAVRQLTRNENPWAGVHATWTPDGKRIIYADQAGQSLELFSCGPDGADSTQLTKLGGAATSPAVSPDGKWISFRLCDEIYWRDSETFGAPTKSPRGQAAGLDHGNRRDQSACDRAASLPDHYRWQPCTLQAAVIKGDVLKT